MTSALNSAELDASQSIGRIYAASHRDELREWLASPGPDSQLLVDMTAFNKGEQYVSDGPPGREYQVTVRRLHPGVKGTIADERTGHNSLLSVDLQAAVAAGKVVSVSSDSASGSEQRGSPRSSRAMYTYVPLSGASGRTAGVLEIATAMHPVDASVSQKQAVFFAVTASFLVVIGYILIVIFNGRSTHMPSGSTIRGAQSPAALSDDGSKLDAIHVGSTEANSAISTRRSLRTTGKSDSEKTDQIRSELVAKFSHEIRTPLNAVLGMADLLRITPLTRKQRTYVHTIQSSGEMLLSLLDNVLDFAKLESESLDVQEHEFDIVRLLDDVLYVMGYFAYSKGLELVGTVRNSIDLRITGDKRRLRQILVNLVGNAIKYTDAGEIVIDIDCQPESDSRYKLNIRVLDTGIGINPSIRHKLFQPFVSESDSESMAEGSAGLGLAICKRLIEYMKGQIWLDDREGGGTIAGFSVPVRRVPQTDSSANARPAKFPDYVLIVHRTQVAAESLRRLLDYWNVQSKIVDSTGDMLKQLQHSSVAGRKFDAVILDSDLGSGDRLEQVREIRSIPGFEKLPFILLIPITESLEVGEISRLGPIRCVNKPLLLLPMRDYLESVFADNADELPVGIDNTIPNLCNPMKILIAEDNPINAKLLLKMLQSEGHDADVVTDGLGALKAIRETKYDLVLMDCQMPGMDGDEVTRQIYRDAQHYQVPALIVAVTADTTEETRARCFESGMGDFLIKPVRLAKLRKGLARWSFSIFGVALSTSVGPEATQVRSKLRDRMGLVDEDFLGSYIDLFLEDTDQRLRVLAEAVSRGDMTVADRGCHALKGGCMEFGAERMSRLCEELSAAAKSGDNEVVVTLFSRLEKEYVRLRPVYQSALSH